MHARNLSRSDKLYHTLLRVLPFDFRGDFGPEMEEVFREQRARAEREGGRAGVLRLWWETIAGIFRTAPGEHLSILRHDLRYALRMMRNNLSYTALAVLTLGLGIGANTAIFSVINAVLLRPLPYGDGDRLVLIGQQARKPGVDLTFSVPEIADYRAQNRSFSQLAEYHVMRFTLFTKSQAERVRTGVVSHDFFDMFGVRPILGRTFLASDDKPGAPAVLVLSYEYWKQHHGGDPNIVGTTYKMNDRVHTVIGVLPPLPQYPDENDVYMPTSACPFRSAQAHIVNRNMRMMRLFGRLKPGITVEQSRSDVQSIAARLEHDYPQAYPPNLGFMATSDLLRQEVTRQAKPTLFVLLAAAGLVLLIACANVANLTLARMARRERELIVRSALGAGKGRLLRQLVTESFLMSLLAAAAGTLFASQTLRLLTQFAARLTPRAREIQMDGAVLLFALLAAVATSIVFGTMSALYSREELSTGLREGGFQTTAGRYRQRARSALIVFQVAFSFVLLIGAGLMLRSFARLRQVDPGFVPQHVLAMKINLNWSRYRTEAQVRDIGQRILTSVESQPGILSAALSSSFPLDPDLANGRRTQGFYIEGHEYREAETPPLSAVRVASPDYFKTLGIRLLAGRVFTLADNHTAPPVAVINQSLARHYWKGEDPVGRRISFNRGQTWMKVIGITADVKEVGLNRAAADEIYIAEDQSPTLGAILVRTQLDPMDVANQVRRAILDLDSETAIPTVKTLDQVRADNLESPRLMTDLLGIFGALALVIAVTGIGGILALTVNQRVHEIGIRVALGAKPRDVATLVLNQGMFMVMAGLALGIAGALAFTRLLKTLLYEVTPTDAVTFAGVSLLFALAAMLASYLPARRAARIDPLIALRRE